MKDAPATFGMEVLDIPSTKKNLIRSTVSYFPHSIKSKERKRRGKSDKILLHGPSTRKPPDMKTFENKSQLNQLLLLLDVWGSREPYDRLEGRNVTLIVEVLRKNWQQFTMMLWIMYSVH